MIKQTPINFSDYALVYGGQACGLLGGWLTYDNGAGVLEIIVAACNAMILGTVLLFLGLLIVRQPPAIVSRIKNGEPIDDFDEDKE
jgi:hypothetical protein